MSGKAAAGAHKPRGRFDFLAQTSFALFSQKTKEMGHPKNQKPHFSQRTREMGHPDFTDH
jgi:hypothetical protein